MRTLFGTIFFLSLLIVGCNPLNSDNSLIGSWRYEDGEYWEEWMFNQDGTYAIETSEGDFYTGQYTSTEETITMTGEGYSLTYEYSVIGNSLVLSYEEEQWLFSRL